MPNKCVVAYNAIVDQKVVDDVIELANELQNIASTVIGEKQSLKDDNHFGLMALAFSIRQFQHLESILSLIETKNYRDTALIARTMIEGFAYLNWAAELPTVRAYRWRAFAWLIDARLLDEQQSAGDDIDVAYKGKVEKEIREHEQILLKPKYLRTRKSDIPSEPDKRFIKDFFIDEQGSKMDFKRIIRSAPVGSELWSAYEMFSNRNHWQLEDLQMERRNDNSTFVGQKKFESWRPYLVGILTLCYSLGLLNEILKLDCERVLEEFDTKFGVFLDRISRERT